MSKKPLTSSKPGTKKRRTKEAKGPTKKTKLATKDREHQIQCSCHKAAFQETCWQDWDNKAQCQQQKEEFAGAALDAEVPLLDAPVATLQTSRGSG